MMLQIHTKLIALKTHSLPLFKRGSQNLNFYLETSNSEKRQELIDAGVLVGKSHSDIMEMKENFMVSTTDHEKSITNDVSDTYKFHSGGETLWSLRSVVKLGMFMERTESAKLFRDSIIEELQAGVTFKKAYQSTTQAYLQQMELSAQKLKSAEIQELLEKDLAESGRLSQNLGYNLIKNGSNTSVVLENGTEFKLNNNESWYLTPEAVLDLCMFMTGTDKAIQVRSAIINKLKEGCKSHQTIGITGM